MSDQAGKIIGSPTGPDGVDIQQPDDAAAVVEDELPSAADEMEPDDTGVHYAVDEAMLHTDLVVRKGAALLGLDLTDTAGYAPWRSYLSMRLWHTAIRKGQP